MTDAISIGVVVVAFASVSGRLRRSPITPAMVFLFAGVGFGAASRLDYGIDDPFVGTLFTATLAVVLFTDATRIDVARLRDRLQVPVRLLTIGLFAAILLGTAVALPLFELGFWEAVILSIVLAPTDAALGQAVVTSPKVPKFVRQTLNVESGLNDGLALPLLTIAIAFAGAAQETQSAGHWAAFAVRELGVAIAVGASLGYAGGRIVSAGRASGWMTVTFSKLAGLALALLAYTVTVELEGSGFIAAFVAGAFLGWTAREACEPIYEFAETEGQLLQLLTFLFFGAIAVAPAFERLDWRTLVYALASLTIVRGGAVALALVGTPVLGITVAFIGWFGPRGLASILFGLLVIEEAGMGAAQTTIFSIVTVTVVLSTVLHGLTAAPLAGRYGGAVAARRAAEMADMSEMREMPDLPTGFRTDD